MTHPFPFSFPFIWWIHWRSHIICPVHRCAFSHSVMSNSWLLHGHLFYESEKWKSLSHGQLFATPWTIESMEFSRPESWSGWPFPSPRDLPNSGLPHCRWILYQLTHQGSHICSIECSIFSICLVVSCWYHLTCSSVLFIFCELEVISGALFRFKFNFLAMIFHRVLCPSYYTTWEDIMGIFYNWGKIIKLKFTCNKMHKNLMDSWKNIYIWSSHVATT